MAKIKKEITGKAVGRNVIINIAGVKYSKAFKVKQDRLDILEKVTAYNTRNSKAKEKELIKLMAKPVKKVLKPKAVPKPKAAKNPVSKVESAKAKDAKEKEAKKPARTSRRSAGGEY